MEVVDLARRSITIVGSFLSTFEIARINKSVISEKEGCVRAHRHAASESEQHIKGISICKKTMFGYLDPRLKVFHLHLKVFHHLTTAWSPLLNLHGWSSPGDACCDHEDRRKNS